MSFRLRVFRVVHLIPPGKVATYGQIAALAGAARAARAAGAALRTSSGEPDLPWHRVINAQGRVSRSSNAGRPDIQRRLLEDEGVVFSRAGRCKLSVYLWEGPEEALVWEDG